MAEGYPTQPAESIGAKMSRAFPLLLLLNLPALGIYLAIFGYEGMNHMKTSGLIVAAGLSFGPCAHATWWTPMEIRRFCNKLLTAHKPKPVPPTPFAVSHAFREDFNRLTLSSSRALIVYEPNNWIEVADTGQKDVLSWLDTVTRRAINVALDSHLPDWRRDRYWYFQTSTVTSLFSPKSPEPIVFSASSFILMQDQFAVGEIFLANMPTVDLFD